MTKNMQLTKETIERLDKMKDQEERVMMEKFYLDGDEKAREGLILKNVKLVERVLENNFNFSAEEYEDARMDGILVLERAIDEYEINQVQYFHSAVTRKILIALTSQYPNKVKTGKVEENEVKENIVIEGDLSDHYDWNEEMINALAMQECMKIVREYLDELPGNIGELCEYHWGLNDGTPKTLQETADKFGMTREGVRGIVSRHMQPLARRISKGMRLGDLLNEESEIV